MRNFVLIPMILLLNGCGINPEKSDKLTEEGIVLTYYARYDEAIEKYTEAIRLNPENFEAFFYRANAKTSLKQYDDAIMDYNEAIRLHPKYADAYANRGQVKFYQGDKPGACEDWLMAEQLGKPNMDDITRQCK